MEKAGASHPSARNNPTGVASGTEALTTTRQPIEAVVAAHFAEGSLSVYCFSSDGYPLVEKTLADKEIEYWHFTRSCVSRKLHSVVSLCRPEQTQSYLQRYAFLLSKSVPLDEIFVAHAEIITHALNDYSLWLHEIESRAVADPASAADQFYSLICSLCDWKAQSEWLLSEAALMKRSDHDMWTQLVDLCSKEAPSTVVDRLPHLRFESREERALLTRLYVEGGLCLKATDACRGFVAALFLSIENPTDQDRLAVEAFLQVTAILTQLLGKTSFHVDSVQYPDPEVWAPLFSGNLRPLMPVMGKLLIGLAHQWEGAFGRLSEKEGGSKQVLPQVLRLLRCWADMATATLPHYVGNEVKRAEWWECLRGTIEKWMALAEGTEKDDLSRLESIVLDPYTAAASTALSRGKLEPAQHLISIFLRRQDERLIRRIVPLIVQFPNPDKEAVSYLIQVLQNDASRAPHYIIRALSRCLLRNPKRMLQHRQLTIACWAYKKGQSETYRGLIGARNGDQKKVLFDLGFLELCKSIDPFVNMLNDPQTVSAEQLVRLGKWLQGHAATTQPLFLKSWLAVAQTSTHSIPELIPILTSLQPASASPPPKKADIIRRPSVNEMFELFLQEEAYDQIALWIGQNPAAASCWRDGLSSKQTVQRAAVLAQQVPDILPQLVTSLDYLDTELQDAKLDSRDRAAKCLIALFKAATTQPTSRIEAKLLEFVVTPARTPRWKGLDKGRQRQLVDALLSWRSHQPRSPTFVKLINALMTTPGLQIDYPEQRLKNLALHCQANPREWNLFAILPGLFEKCSFTSTDIQGHARTLFALMPRNHALYSLMRIARERQMPIDAHEICGLAQELLTGKERLSLDDREQLARFLLEEDDPTTEPKEPFAIAYCTLALELACANRPKIVDSLLRRASKLQATGPSFERGLRHYFNRQSAELLQSMADVLSLTPLQDSNFSLAVRRALTKSLIGKADDLTLTPRLVRYLQSDAYLLDDLAGITSLWNVMNRAFTQKLLNWMEAKQVMRQCSARLEALALSSNAESIKQFINNALWSKPLIGMVNIGYQLRTRDPHFEDPDFETDFVPAFLSYTNGTLEAIEQLKDRKALRATVSSFRDFIQILEPLSKPDQKKFHEVIHRLILCLSRSDCHNCQTILLQNLIKTLDRPLAGRLFDHDSLKQSLLTSLQVLLRPENTEGSQHAAGMLRIVAGIEVFASDLFPTLAIEYFNIMRDSQHTNSDRLHIDLSRPIIYLGEHREEDSIWNKVLAELLESYLTLMAESAISEHLGYALQFLARDRLPISTEFREGLVISLTTKARQFTADQKKWVVYGALIALHLDEVIADLTFNNLLRLAMSSEDGQALAEAISLVRHCYRPEKVALPTFRYPTTTITFAQFALEFIFSRWGRRGWYVDSTASINLAKIQLRFRAVPEVKTLLNDRTNVSDFLRSSAKRASLHLDRIYCRTGIILTQSDKFFVQSYEHISLLLRSAPPVPTHVESELFADTVDQLCQRLVAIVPLNASQLIELLKLASAKHVFRIDEQSQELLLTTLVKKLVGIDLQSRSGYATALRLWEQRDQVLPNAMSQLNLLNAMVLEVDQQMPKRQLDEVMELWAAFLKEKYPDEVKSLTAQLSEALDGQQVIRKHNKRH